MKDKTSLEIIKTEEDGSDITLQIANHDDFVSICTYSDDVSSTVFIDTEELTRVIEVLEACRDLAYAKELDEFCNADVWDARMLGYLVIEPLAGIT